VLSGGASGNKTPTESAKVGATDMSPPALGGVVTTTGVAEVVTTSVGGAGGLQGVEKSTDSAGGSKEKKKEAVGLASTAADVPKVGTDAASAAVNNDHRQPGAAT